MTAFVDPDEGSQPFDDRHETRAPSQFEFPATSGRAPMFVTPERASFTRDWPSISMPGLHFVSMDGTPFTDMARSLTEDEALANVHEVDLRTMLAHLDSTARAITRELEVRGLGGRR